MEKIQITVTVPGATPKQLHLASASLEKQGVKVEEVLDAIGIITGKVTASQLAKLDVGPDAIIEVDESIQIAPPDELFLQ